MPTSSHPGHVRRKLWIRAAALLVALALGAAGCATLGVKERELTFRVVRETPSWFAGMPAGVQEFDLAAVADGHPQHVHAWWWPAVEANAPALLYLHGSRWDLTGQLFRIEQLHAFGFSVLAIDYRGFGKSDGELPSEGTVYEDARLGWDRLTQLQADPAKRFIYGHSLGGAVAIDLAAKLDAPPAGQAAALPARGLIVESTFTTLADIAREFTVSWLPAESILTQKFDSLTKIAQVRIPVLIVHGSSDRFVPSRFSRALYDAARDPKRLLLVEGGTHNNSMRAGSAEYRQALREMFGVGDAVATPQARSRLPARAPAS
jgi:alpha-beta hydrolase superfamily lysophospholipase